LASLVLNEAVKRAKTEPILVDDVIMAQSYQNGECANGARMALLEAGWPNEVPGVTLDRRCSNRCGEIQRRNCPCADPAKERGSIDI
jgi:acetyl-CoA acetyltransferase